MSGLPVKRMVLYKHGVGFFERYGTVGETAQVELTFKKDEMNDVLKSLAAFPQGDGQVLNVSYETPEDKQAALQKAPILLGANQTLLDLLRSLRGRLIEVQGHEHSTGTPADSLTGNPPSNPLEHPAGPPFTTRGTVLGIDAEAGFDQARVSLLTTGTEPNSRPIVCTYRLPQIHRLDIIDPQSGDDLRYILDLSRARSDKRIVTILLNQPDQDLLVSYVAPTPTWRVSYRLVYTPDPVPVPAPTASSPSSETPQSETPQSETPQSETSQSETSQSERLQSERLQSEVPPSVASAVTGKLFLQGWGIVDNQLDEDLDAVDLTLIAGQPISFIYDLYTPKFVDRPQVADEARTVTGPVMFDQALPMAARGGFGEAEFEGGMMAMTAPAPMAMRRMKQDLATSTAVQATGIARGELFQYVVGTPVSIKRGQSAMVPILGATLDGRKEHLYNFEKVSDHPVVTITAINSSGLTLERGPVTVLEQGGYVGEAVIAFTPAAGEFFVPYAVDLGVHITHTSSPREEMAGIRLGEPGYGYLVRDVYAITQTTYAIENRNPDAIHLVIEQRFQSDAELFATPAPIAQTAEFYRWQLAIAARSQRQFVVQERRLVARQETLRDLDYRTLQNYLRDQFLDQTTYNRLKAILDLHQQVHKSQVAQARLRQEQNQFATEQQQIVQKLQPLDRQNEEGALRQRYVAKLQTLENQTEQHAEQIAVLERAIAQLEAQIQTQLLALQA